MKRHIIVVEDEADLADLIALHLQRENYGVEIFADGEAGLEAIRAKRPDLVVLDLMLPGIDGFEICRRIRRDESLAGMQVLMVTARSEEADVVTGLELGADDYLAKPFRPRELVARVRNLLRRLDQPDEAEELIEVGPLRIDLGRHEVRVEGEEVALTHTEFQILRYLASKPGRVRTRGDILEQIGEAQVLERTIDVHVASLRRKLGAASPLLETVRGVGYRMKD